MKSKKLSATTWLLKLERGDVVIQSLLGFMKSEHISAGSLSGIGALEEVEIGYFQRDQREYTKKKLEGIFELLSLNGNVAIAEDEPMLHIHVILGNADFVTTGGHLFGGKCAVTVEVFVTAFPGTAVNREIDEIGLKLLDL